MTPQDKEVLVVFYQLSNKLTTRKLVALYGSPRGGRILLVSGLLIYLIVVIMLTVFN